jgi:hypothetical protein
MHFFRRVVNCHFDLIVCDGDGGEAFVLQQHAKSITNVVKQRVHDSLGVNAEVWGAHACSVLAIAFCDRELFRNTTEGIETEKKVRLGRMPRPTRCKRVLPGIRIERTGFRRRERNNRIGERGFHMSIKSRAICP